MSSTLVAPPPMPQPPQLTEGAETTPYRWRWLGLCVILAAEIMDLLDSTIVNVAAPSIRADLGGSYAAIQWIAAGYTLAFAVGLITGGRLGDIYGRRRMFMLGAAGFALSSLLCALAVSPELLIGSRVLQGACGAVMIPQGLGIIKVMFPPRELASAFGLFGPVMGLAAVGGPIVAGLLISADIFGAGWRTIFLINPPLGALALCGAWRFLPETKSASTPRLDPLGMALLSAAALLLIYPLVQGREQGWHSWIFGLLAASAPLFGAFIWWQRQLRARGASPLIEPSLFGKRAFNAGLLVSTVFFAAMSGSMLVLALFMQLGLGFSALRTGLSLAPWSLGIAVGAALGGGWLAPRYGRRLLHGGLLTLLAGTAGLYLTMRLEGATVAAWQLAPAGLVSGLGIGLLIAPLFEIVLAGVEEHELGSGSGVLTASQQFGGALGVAVIATVFFNALGSQAGPSSAALQKRFVAAFQSTLWIEAALIALTFGLAFLLPHVAREHQVDAAEY